MLVMSICTFVLFLTKLTDKFSIGVSLLVMHVQCFFTSIRYFPTDETLEMTHSFLAFFNATLQIIICPLPCHSGDWPCGVPSAGLAGALPGGGVAGAGWSSTRWGMRQSESS